MQTWSKRPPEVMRKMEEFQVTVIVGAKQAENGDVYPQMFPKVMMKMGSSLINRLAGWLTAWDVVQGTLRVAPDPLGVVLGDSRDF